MAENKVKTNFLIHDLANKGMTKHKFLFIKFFLPVVLLSLISVILLLINYNYRPDLELMFSGKLYSIFYIQLIVFTTSIFLGIKLTYKLSIPGAQDSSCYKISSIIFYCLWIILLLAFTIAGIFGMEHEETIHANPQGVQRTIIALLVPIITLSYFAFKGYVISKYKSIIMISFTAFSFASLINLFVCPENNAMHILTSHHLIVLPITIVIVCIVYLFSDLIKKLFR